MNDRVTFIDATSRSISESVRVAEWLRDEGYYPATGTGVWLKNVGDTECLGILKNPDPDAKPHKYLFGLISEPPLMVFLGVLTFCDVPCECHGKIFRWNLEFYGRKYTEPAIHLAERLAKTFNVHVYATLVSEEPKSEKFFDDIWT